MARSKPSPKIVEGAIGLVWRDGKLLIARRGAGGHLAGVWEFPGGKLKPKESRESCLGRELKEELGAPRSAIVIGKQRTTLEYDYPDRRVVLHVFDCDWAGGEPELNGDREWRWVEPQRLRRYKFPPANRPLIDSLVTEARTPQQTEEAAPVRPDWPATIRNRLNDLSAKEWLLFQKSWFIHNPPPREKGVVVHPAKFPESLIAEFIRFFTKSGQLVLDPMLGTGSTLLAAHETGRRCVGIELNEKYAEIARERLRAAGASVRSTFDTRHSPLATPQVVITGDALKLNQFELPQVDYCITSPPYWDMLRARGAETQKRRRGVADLDVHYSDDPADLGNLSDYEDFLNALFEIFKQVHMVLKPRGYLTIIVKNIKKGGKIYPLAWDLGKRLSTIYALKDEKIWCQDNQRLAPYGMGNAWVSNTVHHYCLNFRKDAS